MAGALVAAAAMGGTSPLAAGFKVLAALLCVCITVLLVVMLAYQAVLDARAAKTAALRRNVREAVGRVVAGGQNLALRQQDREALFSSKGLSELLRLMEGMTDEARAAMQALLRQLRYEGYVNRQLDAKDPDYAAMAVRMVAAMNLKELDGRVGRLLYVYPGNIGLQYEAFMALSRLGSADPLVQVCMDKEFAQCLSFRSLQEILGAYTGDRAQMYAYLLHAPDAYVVRTCLKLIGTFHIAELAHEVEDKLQKEEGDNLLMDTIRCLGQLEHAPAAAKVALLAKHPRWEVRALVASALGQMNAAASAWALAEMLRDAEWQVRHNAGLALQKAGLLAQVETQVQASGDAFAMDMLRYMAQTSQMWGVAQ